MAHERSTVKGFTYEATDPYVNMGSYVVSRHRRELGTVSRLDAFDGEKAGWDCEAGFFPTRHAAAQALLAATYTNTQGA